MMSSKKFVPHPFTGAIALLAAGMAGPAAAIDFQLFDNTLKIDNLLTLGASFRMQDVDPTLVGKSTWYAYTHQDGTGLCLQRVSGTYEEGAKPLPDYKTDAAGDTNQYEAGALGEGACSTSGDRDGPTNPAFTTGSANTAFKNQPGSFGPNADDGDLNFKKGDIVHAVAKLTTDMNYSYADYNIFVRGVALFDANYHNFQETHYDTTMRPLHTDLDDRVVHLVGVDYDFLDYTISHNFTVFEHDLSVKAGSQVVNWGESSLLALNSLNTINPPDARRLSMPGLDLKEAFRPIGMVTMGTQVIEGISAEGFYTYEWKPVIVDPPGSFFSQSDTLGDGGDFGILSFAKPPEDPGYAIDDPRYPAGKRGYYRAIDTCPPGGGAPCADTLGLLGSTSSRTIYRDHAAEKDREPNGGDYGIVMKTFWESLNNGTEIAFYHAVYDSRLPVVSFFAAEDSCLGDNGSAAGTTFASDCGYTGPGQPDNRGTRGQEPIPVDTARLLVEYPKDIRLWGVSFNTTVGDFALSGEYAFRENLPIQIDTVDLTFAAEQPAFPEQDINLGATTIPGRQSAFPTYVTRYRGMSCAPGEPCINAHDYIPGFERFKVGQANLTILRLIGGDNPLAASQMTLLLEMGMMKVFDMPALGDLQLEGTGSDTHASCGAVEAPPAPGTLPAGSGICGVVPEPPMVPGNNRTGTLRQNPQAWTDTGAWGTSESYGFRFINLNRWDSAFLGINMETLSIVRWDVKGTSPGIGTNFSDGRKQFNFGIRGDYLSTYTGEVRYTWYTGGGVHDGQRDRDNIMVNFGYQF